MLVSELLREAEEDFTEDDIRQVLDDVRFFSDKERMFSKFWANFVRASETEKEEIIQSVVEPLLAKHGYPKPHTDAYAKFQRELRNLK